MTSIERRDGGNGLAPVTPLFGARTRPAAEAGSDAHTPRRGPRFAPVEGREPVEVCEPGEASDAAELPEPAQPLDDAARAADAERALVRALASRGKSEREARTLLAAHELADDEAEAIVQRMIELGYLDDARLAEQIVYTESERKGRGQRVVAQALRARGIDDETAAAALEVLGDDEGERALDVARSKARSLASLDREVALRRLLGQLARRGYSGRSATEAAKQALDEASRQRGAGAGHSVRFV